MKPLLILVGFNKKRNNYWRMDSPPKAYESQDEYGGGSIRLYLIRHGESEANPKSLIGRIPECPLTEKGGTLIAHHR
jgi:hypothetical protein